MNIEREPFGVTRGGVAVERFTLTNDAGMRVCVLTYGGIISELRVPDRNGNLGDVVLGFESLADYETKSPFFGCITGRFANRIAGATFTLDGVDYVLAQNDGVNHLHGGRVGFDKVVWAAEPFAETGVVGVHFHHLSPDGDEGYPGALDMNVTYLLNQQNELRITYHAVTDRPTVVNLTNHTYFNLAGGGTNLTHALELFSDSYTPINQTLIPTGEIRPVDGTPFDFRTPTAIGARIGEDDEQLVRGGGYDHNWIVRGSPGDLRLAARVTESSTGRVLEVDTTQPAIQFYAGNMMPTIIGKGGQEYSRRSGLCLETQHYPDSPNQPAFPSVVLRPGDVYEEMTVFRFRSA